MRKAYAELLAEETVATILDLLIGRCYKKLAELTASDVSVILRLVNQLDQFMDVNQLPSIDCWSQSLEAGIQLLFRYCNNDTSFQVDCELLTDGEWNGMTLQVLFFHTSDKHLAIQQLYLHVG